MKSSSVVETAFLAASVVLVVLVIGLDCLQGSSAVKLFGVLACDYGLTSADLRVKLGGTAILALFLALLFGPVLAVLRRRDGTRQRKRSN
jgi:membrane protein implicated in regulation of membrane protease activity